MKELPKKVKVAEFIVKRYGDGRLWKIIIEKEFFNIYVINKFFDKDGKLTKLSKTPYDSFNHMLKSKLAVDKNIDKIIKDKLRKV